MAMKVQKSWPPLAAATVAVCAALTLAGCMPAAVVGVVGGAAGAGVLLYNGDRRSSETAKADSALEKAGEEAVERLLGGRGRVTVTSYFRRVLLTGEVPTQADWQSVDVALRALPGAQGVFNELAVMESAGLADRSGDAMVTSRVRTKMLNQNGVPSGAVKVLTERGTTYLMGRLTPTEAQQTTEAVSSTEGVQRVVRIFDLIAETPAGGVDGVITPLNSSTPEVVPAPNVQTQVQGVQAQGAAIGAQVGTQVQGVQTGVQGAVQGVQTQVQGVQTGVQGAVQGVQTQVQGVQTGVQGAVQGVQTFPVLQAPVVTPSAAPPIEVQQLPPAQ